MKLFKSKHIGNFFYSTALKLTSQKYNINCETDFVFLDKDLDKKINIVIGECKTNKIMDQDDIDNLVKVKTVLDSELIKAYLLFAKTTQFIESEIVLFKNLLTKGITPILLTTQDFETDDYYSQRGIKIPHPHAMRLEDMASNSKVIYLS